MDYPKCLLLFSFFTITMGNLKSPELNLDFNLSYLLGANMPVIEFWYLFSPFFLRK